MRHTHKIYCADRYESDVKYRNCVFKKCKFWEGQGYFRWDCIKGNIFIDCSFAYATILCKDKESLAEAKKFFKSYTQKGKWTTISDFLIEEKETITI